MWSTATKGGTCFWGIHESWKDRSLIDFYNFNSPPVWSQKNASRIVNVTFLTTEWPWTDCWMENVDSKISWWNIGNTVWSWVVRCMSKLMYEYKINIILVATVTNALRNSIQNSFRDWSILRRRFKNELVQKRSMSKNSSNRLHSLSP